VHRVRAAGVLWAIALAGCADVLGAEFDEPAIDDSCNEPNALRCGGDRLVLICATGHWQRLFECDETEHCDGTPEPSCIPNEITCEYAKGRSVCVGSARVVCDGSGKVVDVEDCLGPCTDGECTSVLQVSAGSGHSCAVVSNGSVRCWGSNQNGALGVVAGYGSSTPRGPTIVELDEPVVEIAAGADFTCALTAARRVRCWGKHIEESENVTSHQPREMLGLADVVAVRAGGFGACAIDAAGHVYCWGKNEGGQLSGVVEKTVSQPQLMPSFEGARELFMGHVDTCARFDDGTVACCGLNDHARFDPDPPSSFNPELAPVPGVGSSESAAVDERQACLLAKDGSVSCWGQNYFGGLCLGDTSDRWAPTRKAILLGYGTLSLTNSGRLECCGKACGDPLDSVADAIPVPILPGGVESVHTSATHACAIVRGRVLCWGNNGNGQVGPVQAHLSVRHPTPVVW
jgi:alpha-tubulin suppressor-like RCC1 family protein